MVASVLAKRLAIGIITLWPTCALTVELGDGTVHFAAVPRLIKTQTTNKDTGSFGATYYFTLSIPQDAGEPLERVKFFQTEGLSRIRFLPQRTSAFEDVKRRQAVMPSEVQIDDQGAISVLFDPPINPGETVVVGLRPRRNPRTDGVYLFGVTAFPAGEKSQGQFLGFGRLHFYDGFRHRSLFHRW